MHAIKSIFNNKFINLIDNYYLLNKCLIFTRMDENFYKKINLKLITLNSIF